MAKESQETGCIKLPFYARVTFILIGFFVLITMLRIGRSIIVPLLFATVLSILLSTVVDFLERKKMDRTLAISLTVAGALIIGGLLGFMIFSRANMFIDNLPVLQEKIDALQGQFVGWLSENWDVNSRKANDWINTARADFISFSGENFGNTLTAIANALVILILIPVYIFLILYYQPLLMEFVHRVIGNGHERDIRIVMGESKSILKDYFAGLSIELLVVAVLNTIGFFALGIDYALLIGILGALLNLVPYLGGMIMLALSMFMALLSKDDPMFAFYAAGVFFLIQTIDNYYLLPKVVGSKVRINALVSIVVVIAGGAIWGIAGMFLALPLTAVLKVIFDRIDAMNAWGFLLGDTMPPLVRLRFKGRKKD